jgi:hypothetical protein
MPGCGRLGIDIATHYDCHHGAAQTTARTNGRDPNFFRHFLSDYPNSCYSDAFADLASHLEERKEINMSEMRLGVAETDRPRRVRGERKKRLGGQRKSLKRLDSDKGIKGNQSLFL